MIWEIVTSNLGLPSNAIENRTCIKYCYVICLVRTWRAFEDSDVAFLALFLVLCAEISIFRHYACILYDFFVYACLVISC